MRLVDDIAGLRGENLASALLAHLLLRSEPVRRAVIRTISDISPVGPIIVNKHFSVFTEVSASIGQQDEDGSRSNDAENAANGELPSQGRIDILIQTDDAVVGVENKFGADFQVGQPRKYLDLVRTKAEQLAHVWPGTFQPILVVLAPERRRDAINDVIESQGIPNSCRFLAWQDLLKSLKRKRLPDLDAVDRFLVEELEQFVKQNIGSFDIERLVIHLNNPWQPGGSAVVREFFGKVIWNLIDQHFREEECSEGHTKNLTTPSIGLRWYGYYLTDSNGARPWIGFISGDQIPKIDGREALFVVGLKNQSAAEELCSSVDATLVRPRGWEGENLFCVAVNYGSNWTKHSKWFDVMKRVNEALSK
jgi:hypothetical protein